MSGLFLVIGIILSILSKWLQFNGQSARGCARISGCILSRLGAVVQLAILQNVVGGTIKATESAPLCRARRWWLTVVPVVRLARFRPRRMARCTVLNPFPRLPLLHHPYVQMKLGEALMRSPSFVLLVVQLR